MVESGAVDAARGGEAREMARRDIRIAPCTRRAPARELWREPRLPDPTPGHRVLILALACGLVGVPLLLCLIAAAEAMRAPLRAVLAGLAP